MRIIAGEKRGHTIIAPQGMDTRPTQDRVREAIFGMFQFDIPGGRVLDLFAGSGAMGLEALSRGASFAVFNDASRASVSIVKTNVEKLGYAAQAQILNYEWIDAINRLSGGKEKFDFIFIDPPYRSGIYETTLEHLVNSGLIALNGRIIVERANEIEVSPVMGLALANKKRYGRTTIEVYNE